MQIQCNYDYNTKELKLGVDAGYCVSLYQVKSICIFHKWHNYCLYQGVIDSKSNTMQDRAKINKTLLKYSRTTNGDLLQKRSSNSRRLVCAPLHLPLLAPSGWAIIIYCR